MRFATVYKPRSRRGKNAPWLIALSIAAGRRRIVTGFTSRGDTEQLADRLSRIVQRVRANQASEREIDAEITAARPLAHAVDEYHDHLYATGKTPKHADQMWSYVGAMLKTMPNLADITPAKVEAAAFAAATGTATRKRHLDALKAFLAWGVSDRRWSRDVLDGISGVKIKSVRERVRRVLDIAELAKLIEATDRRSPAWAIIYRVTLAAGLRAGEINEVQIVGEHIKIESEKTKNRRGAWIRLPAELAAQAATVNWPVIPAGNLARQLRSDLQAAGIPYETPAGVFDFHALRHQCGALLASAGVPVKAIQKHMRHASIRMTLDTYGHLLDVDRHATNAALDFICQRVAQRAGVGSDMNGTANRNALAEDHKGKWSDGESNPDLLNAIQKSDAVLSLIDNTLRSKRGRAVAPRAAQRLLARAFARASRRSGVAK